MLGEEHVEALFLEGRIMRVGQIHYQRKEELLGLGQIVGPYSMRDMIEAVNPRHGIASIGRSPSAMSPSIVKWLS
jgi:hypothetical protein